MAVQLGSNFNYNGPEPNFQRDKFETLESMKNYDITNIDEGHISYCTEDKHHYIFDSEYNDTITGHWKRLNMGVYMQIISSAEYEALNNKDPNIIYFIKG